MCSEKIPSFEKIELTKIADELNKMQAMENDGRGVSCVQTVIVYLRLGDLGSAKAVCNNEGDKIRNYPKIKEYIKKTLFKSDKNHPWSFEDSFKKKN